MYREKVLDRNVRRCKHIKTNGIQCGSPALREHDCCYFHRQARRDFPRRQGVKDVPETVIDLALIDDPDGIHYALMQVIQGLLNRTLDHKTAGLSLQALQIMSSNFKRTSFQRQLDLEFRKSELNAYQLWEKMEKEEQEEAATRLHEKRVEELKRLERTCCQCGKETEEVVTDAPSNAPSPKGEGCGTPASDRTAADPAAVNAGDPPASGPQAQPLTINACAALMPSHDVYAPSTQSSSRLSRFCDFPILRFYDFPISRSSTLERTLCDPDSLPSSGGPTRASQRC